MTELGLASLPISVRVQSDDEQLPTLSADFLGALASLVRNEGAEACEVIRLRVRRETTERTAESVRRTFTAPVVGALAALPPSPRVRALASADGRFALDWHVRGGLLLAERRSGCCELVGAADAPDLGWMLNYVVATVFAWAGACHPVHSTAVRFASRTMLIAGPSGSGKTSLALALFAHGGKLLTEDITYVDDELRLAPRPIRGFFHARAGMLRGLPWLRSTLAPGLVDGLERDGSPAELLALGRARQVEYPLSTFLDDCVGYEPQPVDLVLVPQIVAEGKLVVEELDLEAVEELVGESLPRETIDWAQELVPRSALRAPRARRTTRLPRAVRIVVPVDRLPDVADLIVGLR